MNRQDRFGHSSTEGNTICPISRIPPEILSDIFVTCYFLDNTLRENGYYWSPPRRDPPVEILITHVSRFWRDVAISTSTLWTEPPIIFPSESIDLCKVYLERSNTQTVALVINFTKTRDRAHKRVHDPFAALTLVSENLSRCHRLNIESGYNYVIDGLTALLDMIRDLAAPNLVFLNLDIRGIHLEPLWGVQRTTFQTHNMPRMIQGGTPKLRYLHLGGSIFDHALPPMNHLTHLQVGCLSSRINFDIFQHILFEPSRLTHLSFQYQKVPWDEFKRADAIQCHMPYLVYLYLSGYHETADDSISLNGMYDSLLLIGSWAPNLQTLGIGFSETNRELNQYLQFSQNYTNRFSKLETLMLETCEDEKSLLALTQAFPSVVNFIYNLAIPLHDNCRDKFLQPLSHLLVDPLQWPHLRSLTIVHNTIDVRSLVDIVRTRAALGVCALNELYVPIESMQQYPYLEALVRGLIRISPTVDDGTRWGDIFSRNLFRIHLDRFIVHS